MTHKDRILRHLTDYGSITSFQAIYEYGCSRLSEYIRQLRVGGYPIISKWCKGKNRYNEDTHYVEYILEKIVAKTIKK